jgi:hypothetical protein
MHVIDENRFLALDKRVKALEKKQLEMMENIRVFLINPSTKQTYDYFIGEDREGDKAIIQEPPYFPGDIEVTWDRNPRVDKE